MRHVVLALCLLAACGRAEAPLATVQGVDPRLPAPEQRVLPTVNIAPATT